MVGAYNDVTNMPVKLANKIWSINIYLLGTKLWFYIF